MRALVVTRHGAPDVLRLQELPAPQPGPGEVRIAVVAAGVNFVDLTARLGLYHAAPRVPAVIGLEVAGVVDAVGPEVDAPALGARVCAPCHFGGYAESVVVNARDVVAMPDTWSFEEAAAFPVSYGAAYAALVRYGALRANERLLVHSAAGAVGVAAVQIASLLGAEVLGTAAAHKHAAVAALGAAAMIDPAHEDVTRIVRGRYGAREALDVVLDPLGGRSLGRSYRMLRAGGRLVCYGASAAVSAPRRRPLRSALAVITMPVFHPLAMLMRSRSVIGLDLGAVWSAHGSLEQISAPLVQLVAEHDLRPVVAATFPLADGARAHQYLHERRNIGKVVLRVSDAR